MKISTVSQINGDFGRKLQNFPHPLPLTGSHWNFVTAVALKTRVMPIPSGGTSLTMHILLDIVHECDGQSDRQTDEFVTTISRSACISMPTRDNNSVVAGGIDSQISSLHDNTAFCDNFMRDAIKNEMPLCNDG